MSSNVITCCQRLLGSILRSHISYKPHVFHLNKNGLNLFLRTVSDSVNTDKEMVNKVDDKGKNKYNKYFKGKNDFIKDVELKENQDPDVFGTLNKDLDLQKKLEEMPEEEDDVHETVIYNDTGGRRQLTINQYGKIIKRFLEKKKLGNAIAVLEKRMLKEDKAMPDKYIYNLLITGCAHAGYTKKAFQLYNQMKKRGLEPSASTYTSLFNACSASPWRSDGLKRLKRLREIMLEKGYIPNQSNYHAMIKAYGRCNDLESAFNAVDEMIENNVNVTTGTFNFLLQACITDSEAGLRHGLLVWNKMLKKGIRPDYYSFNLILRCARDCGLGSLEATTDVIQTITGSSEGNKMLLENDKPNENLVDNRNLTVPTVESSISNNSLEGIENRPNLISKRPHLGNIIGLGDITQREHRLLLLGGCEGFLQEMKLNGAEPDIKTFSQLLETIPSTLTAEKSLLNNLSKYNVEPDVDFFNILVKKRSMRCDYTNARDVLKLIQRHRFSPDIVTFGVMALTCHTIEEATQLKTDIDEAGYRLNNEILGALLRNAVVTWDCKYVIEVMRTVIDECITPCPKFMSYLQQFYSSVNKYKKMNENKSMKELSDTDKTFISKINDEEFIKLFNNYCVFFKKWRKKVIPAEPVHPYAQFQIHNEPEDIEIMNTGRG
ncbi:pentatricopeptide repeat-containing protein 1, mitochondrial [Lycorma delicatula]|uniref:pentatricopeptide repeat-containing protein 1, mitochondrial n=1 Tax=Lycorma delicatula TaxID=130591 RepID=UPI003F50EE3B